MWRATCGRYANVTADARRVTGALPRVWRFFGADQPNYATMKVGRKLLAEPDKLRPGEVCFRAHNLLSSVERASETGGDENKFAAPRRRARDRRLSREVIVATGLVNISTTVGCRRHAGVRRQSFRAGPHLATPLVQVRRRGNAMSMLGAGELCRAILEDKEVARAFDLDADDEMSLFSTYLHAAEHPATPRSQLRVVNLDGYPQSATQTLATLGLGGASPFP
jgi:hypothetical protein